MSETLAMLSTINTGIRMPSSQITDKRYFDGEAFTKSNVLLAYQEVSMFCPAKSLQSTQLIEFASHRMAVSF